MSTITFKALINDIHFDMKKGALKIQLIGASHVSLDKLATLGPHDETVQVTLESAQTRLDAVGDHISLDPEIAKRYEEEAEVIMSEEANAKLKEAAERLRE